jgi:hypothetical protein
MRCRSATILAGVLMTRVDLSARAQPAPNTSKLRPQALNWNVIKADRRIHAAHAESDPDICASLSHKLKGALCILGRQNFSGTSPACLSVTVRRPTWYRPTYHWMAQLLCAIKLLRATGKNSVDLDSETAELLQLRTGCGGIHRRSTVAMQHDCERSVDRWPRALKL